MPLLAVALIASVADETQIKLQIIRDCHLPIQLAVESLGCELGAIRQA